ncbi:MAG: hypothetical protein KJ043_08875, partial [Anaerolineae bacterium]|nr:hypothetical protein [Anaerolineae bacterium]
MTFNLTLIAIFVAGGYIYSLLLPKAWRKWALFIASVLAVYALQPPLLVRYMDFILPTATLLVATLVWALTIPRTTDNTFRMSRNDLFTVFVLLVIITGLALMRLLPPEWRLLTASRPPDPLTVFLVIVPILVLILLIGRGAPQKNQRQ